jgi:hypothetical protein
MDNYKEHRGHGMMSLYEIKKRFYNTDSGLQDKNNSRSKNSGS